MRTRLPLYRPRFVVLTTILTASLSAAPAAENPKDHLLFVGSDFTVRLKKRTLAVVGAGDRTFILQDGDKRTEVPLRKLPDVQMSRGLKLTNLAARISAIDGSMSSDAAVEQQHEAAQVGMAVANMAHIERDRATGRMLQTDISRLAYSPENPISAVSLKFAEDNQRLERELRPGIEQRIQMQASFTHDLMMTTGSRAVNDGMEIELTPEISTSTAHLVVAGSVQLTSTRTTLTADSTVRPAAGRIVDHGNGESDRFDLNFDVAAPQPLENAYLVIVTEYSARERPSEMFRRVLTQRIGRVDATPRRIRLYQTGFPTGFRVRTYMISLYADGQEVATNLSDTKLEMTRDEAFEYIMAEHMARHRGKTVPPAAVLMTSRAHLRQMAAAPEARQPVYVSVDENGRVLEISADSKRSRPPPPLVTATLQRHFAFVPALNSGVPAAGRARLVVADFAR